MKRTIILCLVSVLFFSCAGFPLKKKQAPLDLALSRADYVSVEKIIQENKRKGRKGEYHLSNVLLYAALFSENKTLPEWEMKRAAEVYVDIAKLFIDNGADVNEAGLTKKNTPLIEAVAYYRSAQKNENKIFTKYFFDMTELLVKSGAKFSIRNEDNNSALYYAIIFNTDMAFIKKLVSLGADVSEKVGKYDYPILFHAAEMKTNDYFDYLLSQGADINAGNQFGAGIIASMIAEMSNVKADEKLINEKVNYLIKKKANVNQVSTNNISPLFVACMLKLEDVSKNLLNHKADPNIATKDGTTCFFKAVTSDMSINTLEFFLRKGAKPDVFAITTIDKNTIMITPMVYSVIAGKEDVIKLLLKYKSDPNARPLTVLAYYASPLEWVKIFSKSTVPDRIALMTTMNGMLEKAGAIAFEMRPH